MQNIARAWKARKQSGPPKYQRREMVPLRLASDLSKYAPCVRACVRVCVCVCGGREGGRARERYPMQGHGVLL